MKLALIGLVVASITSNAVMIGNFNPAGLDVEMANITSSGSIITNSDEVKTLSLFQDFGQVEIFKNSINSEKSEIESKKQVKRVWVTITAYSSDPNQTDSTPFVTASGKTVADGIIAANFLNFGTKVYIPELFGNKQFVVEDRLHARFSDRVDIWMPSTEMALKFGKQYALVEIEM